jgi:hypothetical protein
VSPQNHVPPDVERLLAERQNARASKDFARADAIRDEIAALGFDVRDTPAGATAEARAAFTPVDPAAIKNLLDEPAQVEFSIHLLYEGFPDDVERFLAGLAKYCASHDYEVVLVDNASDQTDWLESLASDLSFQLRALGTKAMVVPLPAAKHTHRGWATLDEEQRDKRSKRNWNTFFDRWKHQHEMLLSHRD